MANRSPKQENLVRQKPSWKHLPTKAVRIPEVFESQVMEVARSLDGGANRNILVGCSSSSIGNDIGRSSSDVEAVIGQLASWTLEDLIRLQQIATLIVERKKEETCDRRLEQAILYLADRCDGAGSADGAGFNKVDKSFGHWLANRIESKQPLISVHAEAALKMLGKYSKQLERGGLTLPSWEAIAHQYPSAQKMVPPDGQEELSERRIEIKKSKIAVYAPYDSTGKFQRACKEIEGYKFNSEDKGWYFPLSQLEEVLAAFPAEEYEYDPNIEGAIALLNQQREEERAAKEALALEASSEIIRLIQAADMDAPLANGWYLRDYQKRGVEWLLAHRQGGIYRGGILADDMGLGKSLVALVAARAMQKTFDCPVFIVAPVSVLDNWHREAERAEVRIETSSWAKLPKPLETSKYVLIADEAHYMQSGDQTKRGREALELAGHENCLASWLLSVAGETPVVIKDNDRQEPRLQVMTMAEAVEFMGLEGEGTKLLKHHERFFVRTFNGDKNCMEWARVYGVQAHYSPEPLITIEAEAKTSIRVTRGHSLYVFRNGKVIQPMAQDIVPGDYLIRDAKISIEQEVSEIDLVELIASYESAKWDYTIYGDFGSEILMLKSLGKINYDTAYNWIHNSKYGYYINYSEWALVGCPGNYNWIAGRKGSRGHGAKPIIPVEAIAWLVGYVTGDGWVSQSRLSLAIANSDLDKVISRLHDGLDGYFDWGYDIRKYPGCVNLRINCKPLCDLFYYWFGGQKALTKRLPSDCFGWTAKARRLVLEGLIDSDGYSETVKSIDDPNLETVTVVYTSISKMLLEDIKVLLLTFGIESAIYKRSSQPDDRPKFSNTQPSYSIRFCTRRIQPSFSERQTHKLGFSVQDAQILRVKSVTEGIPSKELVYDFAVEETENFVASGVVCHNTGTPLKNGRPINLFPLLEATGHKLAADRWQYQRHFCNAHHEHFGKKSVWVNTGAAHLDELAKKTEDVILRRTKQECLTELPEKTRLFKEVELETKEASAYSKKIRELVENYRQRAKDGKVDADAEALVTLNILRKVGSEAKVRSAIALAEELLEQGQQAVLFTEFVESAKAIHEALGGELLTGESKDRQAMVDRFQSGESKAIVGTIKAGGVGITLTAASNVILVDRPWTPADAFQSEDRCWRLGQQNAVFATWLQLGAIDEAIDSLLLSKQQRIELVLKGKRKTLKGLSSPKELAKELLAIL